LVGTSNLGTASDLSIEAGTTTDLTVVGGK
jgi:hypothetical protein